MKVFKKIIICTVFLTISFMLVGCSKKSVGTSPTKVTLGDIGWAGIAPLYVAKEKGLFGPSIDVNIVKIPNLGDIRLGMHAGNVDIYQGTYDMYLQTDGEEAPGVGFMVGDESNGADGFLVKSGINSIEDFRGKSIALEQGLPASLLLQYALKQKGIKMSDLDIKYMSSSDAASAFISNKIDIAGTYEPYITNGIVSVSGAQALLTSKDFPGLFPAIYFASNKLINSSGNELKDFAMGYFSALNYIEKNPEESNQIMAKAFDMSVEDFIKLNKVIKQHGLNENKRLFDKSNSGSIFTMFDEIKTTLSANGIKVAPNTPENSISDRIIQGLSNK